MSPELKQTSDINPRKLTAMADTVISTEILKPVNAGRKTEAAGINQELRALDAVAAGKDGEGRLTGNSIPPPSTPEYRRIYARPDRGETE